MAAMPSKIQVEFKTASGSALLVSQKALMASQAWMKEMNGPEEDGLAHDEPMDDFDDDTLFQEPPPTPSTVEDQQRVPDSATEPTTSAQVSVLPAQFPVPLACEPSTPPKSAPIQHTPTIARVMNSPCGTPTTPVTPRTPTFPLRNNPGANKPFTPPTLSKEQREAMIARRSVGLKRKSPSESPLVSESTSPAFTSMTPDQLERIRNNREAALTKRRSLGMRP